MQRFPWDIFPGYGSVYMRGDGYVGKTQDFASRASAHFRATRLRIFKFPGTENFTADEYTALEGYIHNKVGMKAKGTGPLPGSRSGLGVRNPRYAELMGRGATLYQQIFGRPAADDAGVPIEPSGTIEPEGDGELIDAP